jgi:4a-hydroxytetrahydrobiopterin dehydratase
MDTRSLTKSEQEKMRVRLRRPWEIINDKLVLVVTLANFRQAITIMNQIAELAEAEQHHPDLCVFGYKNLEITIYTHSVNGLTKDDFKLAERMEETCL